MSNVIRVFVEKRPGFDVEARQMLADLCGLTRSAIARYERGERFPTIENLIVLADFFDTSIDNLIGRK